MLRRIIHGTIPRNVFQFAQLKQTNAHYLKNIAHSSCSISSIIMETNGIKQQDLIDNITQQKQNITQQHEDITKFIIKYNKLNPDVITDSIKIEKTQLIIDILDGKEPQINVNILADIQALIIISTTFLFSVICFHS